MKKFKEVLSKNNYLVAKIAGGVVAGVTAIIVIIAITAKDKEVAAEVRTTSHEEIITVEEEKTSTEQIVEEKTSTEQIVEEKTSLKELSSNIEVTSEEEITTNIVVDSGETSAKESTTKQATTVKQTTTAKPTTTKSTTSKQVQPTTEEETTQPPRGANGVILETLTLQHLIKGIYTIPDTWEQFCREYAPNNNSVGILILYSDVKSGIVLRNALGNDILLFSSEDDRGSKQEDIIKKYGKPMYEYSMDGNKSILYKYHSTDYDVDNNIFIEFIFYQNQTNGTLAAIYIGNIVDYIEEGVINP